MYFLHSVQGSNFLLKQLNFITLKTIFVWKKCHEKKLFFVRYRIGAWTKGVLIAQTSSEETNMFGMKRFVKVCVGHSICRASLAVL